MGKKLLLASAFLSSICLAAKAPEIENDFPALEVLTRNCAHCHNAKNQMPTDFLQAENLERRETLARVLAVIEKGKMPPGHEAFGKTPDGHRMVRWLRARLKTGK
jgi:mono/diheme cytochrome c family protein